MSGNLRVKKLWSNNRGDHVKAGGRSDQSDQVDRVFCALPVAEAAQAFVVRRITCQKPCRQKPLAVSATFGLKKNPVATLRQRGVLFGFDPEMAVPVTPMRGQQHHQIS